MAKKTDQCFRYVLGVNNKKNGKPGKNKKINPKKNKPVATKKTSSKQHSETTPFDKFKGSGENFGIRLPQRRPQPDCRSFLEICDEYKQIVENPKCNKKSNMS